MLPGKIIWLSLSHEVLFALCFTERVPERTLFRPGHLNGLYCQSGRYLIRTMDKENSKHYRNNSNINILKYEKVDNTHKTWLILYRMNTSNLASHFYFSKKKKNPQGFIAMCLFLYWHLLAFFLLLLIYRYTDNIHDIIIISWECIHF